MTKGKHRRRYLCMALCLTAALLASALLGRVWPSPVAKDPALTPEELKSAEIPDWIESALIRVDGASRRGVELEAFRAIVVHYVGNPGTTARANRNYFDSSESEVSSHFIVGLDGEILQCVPLWERSSASNDRNKDTISIEVCHPDDTGEFHQETYSALVRLTAWLATVGGLGTDEIIRHYDVTGKECPRWFVQHPEAWETFKQDVAQAMKET